jgi:hypothetical protein
LLNSRLAENRDEEVDLNGIAVPESEHKNDREEREWARDLKLTQQMRTSREEANGVRDPSGKVDKPACPQTYADGEARHLGAGQGFDGRG